jgi:putative nucleotidyltransferase with HDIG domain
MRRTGIDRYEELTTRIPAKELSTLLKVSSSLASTLDLTKVLQIAIESTTDLLGLDTGAIYTHEKGSLYLGATTPPLPPQFPEELRLANVHDHPHIQSAITKKTPVYLEDARKAQLTPAEKIVVDSRHLISILYFPLLLQEDAIGVFIVGTTDKVRQFTNSETDLCYILSYQVSLAISNAQLHSEARQAFNELTRSYDAALEGWSRLLDMRDHGTDEHTHRVVDLTILLAQRMGISDVDLGHLRRGALLHDIGKMGIPDSILQKPDKLSEAELLIMKTHPEKAYQLLSQIDYLAPAIDIPYCHHEKWDGSGYPRKLKGEEIPAVARIFAVVDTFDAMTSDRPYRKALSKRESLDYIRDQSGKHFCPEVVTAFLKMIVE